MSKVIVLGDPDNQTRLSRTEDGFALSRVSRNDGVLFALTNKEALQLAEFVLREFMEVANRDPGE